MNLNPETTSKNKSGAKFSISDLAISPGLTNGVAKPWLVKCGSILFITLTTLMISLTPALASTSNGTISTTNKYAWGDVLGWLNFAAVNSSSDQIIINDTKITGYVWSETYGWINLSPTSGGGVRNSCSGALDGFAWSTQWGWINFNGVVINSVGKWTGMATVVQGTGYRSGGTINFDCTNCNVTTDWIPCSSRTSVSTNNSGGGGGGGGNLRPAIATVSAAPTLTPTTVSLPVAPTASASPAKPATPAASATPALKAPSAALTLTLEKGSVNKQVLTLQKFLNSNGYAIAKSGVGSPGKENSSFGKATVDALVKFQTDNNLLSEKGKVGPKTRSLIDGLLPAPKPAPKAAPKIAPKKTPAAKPAPKKK